LFPLDPPLLARRGKSLSCCVTCPKQSRIPKHRSAD
jgi:hypothetical protein